MLDFFKLYPKFTDFTNSDDCIRKTTSKSIRLYPVCIKKKLKFNFKKGLIIVKKWTIQIFIAIIMFTSPSERIFNTSLFLIS